MRNVEAKRKAVQTVCEAFKALNQNGVSCTASDYSNAGTFVISFWNEEEDDRIGEMVYTDMYKLSDCMSDSRVEYAFDEAE